MYLSVVVSVPHSQVRIMFGQCWYGLGVPCHWFRSIACCQEHLHHLVLFVSHLYFTNRYVRFFSGIFPNTIYQKGPCTTCVWEMRCRGPFGMCWMRCTHWKKIKPAIGLPRRILSFGTFMWLHTVQIGRPRFLVKLNDHCPLCVQTGPAIVDANFCPPPPWTQNVVVVINYLIWWRYFYWSWT